MPPGHRKSTKISTETPPGPRKFSLRPQNLLGVPQNSSGALKILRNRALNPPKPHQRTPKRLRDSEMTKNLPKIPFGTPQILPFYPKSPRNYRQFPSGTAKIVPRFLSGTPNPRVPPGVSGLGEEFLEISGIPSGILGIPPKLWDSGRKFRGSLRNFGARKGGIWGLPQRFRGNRLQVFGTGGEFWGRSRDLGGAEGILGWRREFWDWGGNFGIEVGTSGFGEGILGMGREFWGWNSGMGEGILG